MLSYDADLRDRTFRPGNADTTRVSLKFPAFDQALAGHILATADLMGTSSAEVAVAGAPLRLLLEGRPGSGKTTAADRLVELVRANGMSVSGFLTRELREGGERVGFALETLDGRRGLLAHVGTRGEFRVGRYSVVLDDLERLAIPTLSADADLVVVDELGKMELASGPFRDAVTALFERPVALVATVHTSAHPLTDDLKLRPSVTVLRLTRATRDALPARIASNLLSRT